MRTVEEMLIVGIGRGLIGPSGLLGGEKGAGIGAMDEEDDCYLKLFVLGLFFCAFNF